jgi:hypothetical protein
MERLSIEPAAEADGGRHFGFAGVKVIPGGPGGLAWAFGEFHTNESPLMEPITEQEVRAFVGRNADYYLRTWWPALKTYQGGYDQETGADIMSAQPKTGFNGAALLFSGLWLPYRKMYVPTLVLFGVVLFESLLEEILFVGILGKSEVPFGLNRLVGLIVAIVCGAFGNRWYLSHMRKAIADVRSRGLAEEEQLRELSKRGGTSLLASLGFFALYVVAIIVLVIALEGLLGAG